MKTRITSRFARVILASACIAVAAAGIGTAPATTSAQANNPYPVGNSTFWAWQNRPDLPSDLGKARDWATNAEEEGWPVSEYPRPYSIAVYQPGVLGADPISGHVAVVKQVNNDGSYLASQMDESDCRGTASNCGRVNTRVMPPAEGVEFIHFLKDTRTTWGFAGGASGWVAYNMDRGTMQASGWQYRLLGGDPQLISPRLDIPLDGYNAIEVDMALSPGITDASVRFGFATGNQAQFTGAGMARGVADGALHTYHISLAGRADWRGRLSALNLHPAGRNSTGTVRIDRIRLVHDEPGSAVTPPAERTVYMCHCTPGAQLY